MAAQGSFAAMFGGANENVDYSEAARRGDRNLPMPEEDDDLHSIARKMRALASVVESGKSMAVATGFSKAAHQERDPETIARASMTPQELRQYEAWKGGIPMPPFDTTSNRTPVKGGEKNMERFVKRARAMDTIWKRQGFTAENAMWLTVNWNYAVPLVVAVAKVHGAERELVGGQTELTEMELAEVQTAHKAVAISSDAVNRVYRRLNEIARDINQAKETIQAREHAIKARMPNYKQKKDPINQQRQFVGLPAIGSSVDFGGNTGGKRHARTNLMAGSGLANAGATAPAVTGDKGKRRRIEPTPVEQELGGGDAEMVEGDDY